MSPFLPACCLTAALGLGLTVPAPPFQFQDGDRVVLIGSALVEREQYDGYWETALTSRHPDRRIIFRNLGWSGDTVGGDARAGFDTPAQGYQRLLDQVRTLHPTVLVVGYGANESFAGAAGLPAFRARLAQLLDAVSPLKARLVILSPTRHEDLGPPLPDPGPHNRDLARYRDAIRAEARRRGCRFVDLFAGTARTPANTGGGPLTDDGIHLTPSGYWRTAAVLEQALGLPVRSWRVEVDAARCTGTVGTRLTAGGLRLSFQTRDDTLPPPPAPAEWGSPAPSRERILRVRGLPAGTYALHIDGALSAAATAAEWAAGVALMRGPEFDQAERLRRAIVEKNQMFFHRWRPQNSTYLYGFRKHEQGNNAAEVPRFDPLIARKEAEIARLRVPLPHRYEFLLQPDAR